MHTKVEAILNAVGTDSEPVPRVNAVISAQGVGAIERLLWEEGASPRSLIPVHRLAAKDKHYDLQLKRDLDIANDRSRVTRRSDEHERELPVREGDYAGLNKTNTAKGEVMKYTRVANMAFVCLLSAVEATTAAAGKTAESSSSASGGVDDQAGLGPEYKEIASFVHFRQKLIADGWAPVPNPKCREDVVGSHYKDACDQYPDSMSCRVCTLVPELTRKTSDGFSSMRYSKLGRYLDISVYGDFKDIDCPDEYGLDVIGWSVEKEGHGNRTAGLE